MLARSGSFRSSVFRRKSRSAEAKPIFQGFGSHIDAIESPNAQHDDAEPEPTPPPAYQAPDQSKPKPAAAATASPPVNLSKPQSSTLALQRFAVGQGVYCMRSSGEESIGFIVEYDASTGIYKVELEVDDAAGTALYKHVSDDSLRASKAVRQEKRLAFAAGDCVYVKRSNGEESIAWVKSYDKEQKVYKLELERRGSQKYKQAYESMIRAAPPAAVEEPSLMGDLASVFNEPPPPPPPGFDDVPPPPPPPGEPPSHLNQASLI